VNREGLERLTDRLDTLALKLEKMKIEEYVSMLERPARLLYLNFLAGLARGLGFAVGFTILGAVVLYILQRTFVANLPLVGDFIAEIVLIVQQQLGR